MAFIRIAAILLAASGAALATAPPVHADRTPPHPTDHRQLRDAPPVRTPHATGRTHDPRELRHLHEARELRELRRLREARDAQNARGPRNTGGRDMRELRDVRERDVRRVGEGLDGRGLRGPGDVRGPRPEAGGRGDASAQARLATCAYRVKAGTRIFVKPQRGSKQLEQFGSQGRTLGACAAHTDKKWTKVLAPEPGKIGYARTDRLKNLGQKKWLSI